MNKTTKISLIVILIGLIGANFLILEDKDFAEKVAKTTPFQKAKKKNKHEDKHTGEALIGGEFELTDQNEKPFLSSSLKGKYSVIYFGFTSCPMVCPTALNTITLAINNLEKKADNFNFVFITTDPERDTTKVLKEHLVNFSPRFIGLTGTDEQLQKAYQGYKVYAEKVINKDPNNKNYDMNHSSIIYIMDKNGKYIDHLTHENSPEEVFKKLNELE